jgi:hypothetical protein
MSTNPRALASTARDTTAAGWLLVAVCSLGCPSAPERPDRDAARSSASSISAPAQPGSAPAATLPVAASSAAIRAPGDPVGTWTGRYDAKKASVALPAKLKDKGLASDDGKTAVGQGAIELSILADGDIRGKTSGALGAGAITGRLDGATIRAVVRPDDPQAPNAMTGIFVGERKGDIFACDLHVAGPDATMIRESTVELKRGQ